jgi:hypothetical protein
MRPAARLQDYSWPTIDPVQLVVAAVGVRLQDPGVPGQMRFRMLTAPVARVIEHRRRRGPAVKWSIIPHIDPTSPGVGLALGKHRNGRVVAVQPLGRKNMGFDALEDGIERGAPGPDLVGQGG